VGGIVPGIFKIGLAGGAIDNIVDLNLYKRGEVGLVTRSAGMLNEMCLLIKENTSGLFQGIHIGGDTFPGSNFLDHVLYYESCKEVKLIVLLGELGGIQEILVAN